MKVSITLKNNVGFEFVGFTCCFSIHLRKTRLFEIEIKEYFPESINGLPEVSLTKRETNEKKLLDFLRKRFYFVIQDRFGIEGIYKEFRYNWKSNSRHKKLEPFKQNYQKGNL